jgi:hypothetical protein
MEVFWAAGLLLTAGAILGLVMLATRPPQCRDCGVPATDVEEYELSESPRVLAVAYRFPAAAAWSRDGQSASLSSERESHPQRLGTPPAQHTSAELALVGSSYREPGKPSRAGSGPPALFPATAARLPLRATLSRTLPGLLGVDPTLTPMTRSSSRARGDDRDRLIG